MILKKTPNYEAIKFSEHKSRALIKGVETQGHSLTAKYTDTKLHHCDERVIKKQMNGALSLFFFVKILQID